MNRYAILTEGVLDRTLGRAITPRDAAWADYLDHRRAGGDVDPLEPTPEPIEAKRARALARLSEPAARSERRPFTIGAGAFALSFFDQSTLLGVVALDAAGGTLAQPYTLCDITGTPVALTPAQRRNLAEKVLNRRARIYARRKELEAAVAAAADPDNIDTTEGWAE